MLGDMNAWEQFSPGIDSLLVPGGFGQANYKVIGKDLHLGRTLVWCPGNLGRENKRKTTTYGGLLLAWRAGPDCRALCGWILCAPVEWCRGTSRGAKGDPSARP